MNIPDKKLNFSRFGGVPGWARIPKLISRGHIMRSRAGVGSKWERKETLVLGGKWERQKPL